MNYRASVEVVLGVVAPCLKNPGQTKFLLLDENPPRLPSARLREDRTTLGEAAEMLRDLTGVEARIGGVGWVELVLAGVADQVDRPQVAVVYGCMVPEVVALRPPAVWLTLPELLSRRPLVADHLDLVKAVARKV